METIESLVSKITEVKYHEMSWLTFEKLVKLVYGHEFDFVADQNCGNDSQHSFSGTEELDEFEVEDLTKFKETGAYNYMASTLLNGLISSGVLKPGEYLINVSW